MSRLICIVIGGLVGFDLRPRHAKTAEYADALVSPSEAPAMLLCVVVGALIGLALNTLVRRIRPKK